MTGMEANGGTALMNETLNDRDITELLYSGDPQGSEPKSRVISTQNIKRQALRVFPEAAGLAL